jgi:hypothetical protein
LAPLGDPRLVSSAAAIVLGLEMRTEDPLPGRVASALTHTGDSQVGTDVRY